MNEIIEYRKATAEALGLKKVIFEDDDRFDTFRLWHPDTDHNQMAMVEDWLIEHGIRISYEYRIDRSIINEWECGIIRKTDKGRYAYDKSKLIAFRKAFMSYIKPESNGRD